MSFFRKLGRKSSVVEREKESPSSATVQTAPASFPSPDTTPRASVSHSARGSRSPSPASTPTQHNAPTFNFPLQPEHHDPYIDAIARQSSEQLPPHPQRTPTGPSPAAAYDEDMVKDLIARVEKLQREVKAADAEKAKAVQQAKDELEGKVQAADRAAKRAENLSRDEGRVKDKKIVSQTTEISKLKEQLKEAEANCQKATQHAEELRNQLSSNATARDRDLQAHKSREGQSLADKDDTINDLKVKLGIAVSSKEHLEKQVTDLNDLTSQLQATVVRHEEDLAKAKRESETYKRMSAQLSASNASFTSPTTTGDGTVSPEAMDSPTSEAAGAASGAASGSASGSAARERQRYEAMLREKDRRVVQQSAEISRLAKEREKLQAEHAVATVRVEELTKSSQHLTSRNEHLSVELATLKSNTDTTDATIRKLEAQNATLTTHRANLQKSVLDLESELKAANQELGYLKELKKATDAGDAQDRHAKLAALSQQHAVLEQQLATTTKQLSAVTAAKDDEISAADAKILRLTGELTQLKAEFTANASELGTHRALVSELRATLSSTQATLEATQLAKTAAAQKLDSETELWKTKEKTHSEAEAQFVKQIAKLTEQLSAIEKERTVTEKERRKDGVRATVSSQEAVDREESLNNQVYELKKQNATLRASAEENAVRMEQLRSALSARTQEVEQLRQLQMAESTDGTSEASRVDRVQSFLDSISVEVSMQLADRARVDYLSGGGIATAAAIAKAFRMPQPIAQAIADIFCEVTLRLKVTPEKMVDRTSANFHNVLARFPDTINSKVLRAVDQVMRSYAPSDRRRMLAKSRANHASGIVFSGAERVHVFRAIERGGTSITRLRKDKRICALICMFLQPLMVGGSHYGSHQLNGKHEGRTSLLNLRNDGSNAFTVMEARVTPLKAHCVMVTGTYSIVGPRILLSCCANREGALTADTGAWDWSPDDELSESVEMEFAVRWDARHDGLVVNGKTEFREWSGSEAGMVNELYARQPIEAMLAHQSWRVLSATCR